jgi:hypothetical protein
MLYGTVIASLKTTTLLTVPPSLVQQTHTSLVNESGIDPNNIMILDTKNLAKVILALDTNPSLIVLATGPVLRALAEKSGDDLKNL